MHTQSVEERIWSNLPTCNQWQCMPRQMGDFDLMKMCDICEQAVRGIMKIIDEQAEARKNEGRAPLSVDTTDLRRQTAKKVLTRVLYQKKHTFDEAKGREFIAVDAIENIGEAYDFGGIENVSTT